MNLLESLLTRVAELQAKLGMLVSGFNTLASRLSQLETGQLNLETALKSSQLSWRPLPTLPTPDGDTNTTANESLERSPAVGEPNTNTAIGAWQLKTWHAAAHTMPITDSLAPYQPGSGDKILKYGKLVRVRLYGTTVANEANISPVIGSGAITFPTYYAWVWVDDAGAGTAASLTAQDCTGT